MTEFDLYLLVQSAAQEALGEQVLIYGDFASGPRCTTGGPPTHRQLEPGDPVLLDFSVVVWNYRADLARTFICGAEPSARQAEVHAACLEALAAGENLLRAGTRCEDLDRAVRSVLEKHGLGAFHRGHLGHGIGLGHPEPPFIVPESKEVLQVGDVVTLEPGAYIPGEIGLRIERNYVIGPVGFAPLSQHEVGLAPREH
jgi:Xaa-Pro aminopeptidase